MELLRNGDKVESAMREILDESVSITQRLLARLHSTDLSSIFRQKNVYGKEDTMITIQLDMFLAERYDMYYIDKNGEKKRPYIIHRTSLGLLRENSRLAD